MIAWSDVILLAPALSTTSTGLQTQILAIVNRQIDADVWGEFADDGRLYLAAHLGTVSQAGGMQAGLVTGEQVGPLSRNYSLPRGLQGALTTTRFGIEYQRLMKIAVAIPVFVP